MRPICDFERFNPPVLNEKMLRRELEKRVQRRQTILLAAAGGLIQMVLLLLGWQVGGTQPVLALACVCFAIVSTAGSGVIAIVYAQKGEVGCDGHAC